MNTLTTTVARLRVRPGDTLALQLDRPLRAEQRAHLAQYLAGALPPGVRTLVVDMPAKLAVLEDAGQLFTDADAEAVTQAAAALIWHSMRKFGGDPSHVDYHALDCGCTECT